MFSSSASAGSVTQMIAVSLDAVAQTYSAEKKHRSATTEANPKYCHGLRWNGTILANGNIKKILYSPYKWHSIMIQQIHRKTILA